MNTLIADDEEKRYASLLSVQADKSEPVPTSQLSTEEQSYGNLINNQIETEREVLRQSLMMSVNKNPDQVAQIAKLSKQSGLPQPTVERNLATVVAETRSRELSEAARYSPILARQLTDPKFASVAYDDSPALTGLEAVLTKGRDYAGSLPKGIVKDAGGLLSGFGELYGVATRQLESGLDAVLPNSAMSFLRTPVPWYVAPEQILKRPGQTLKDFGDVIGAPKNRQGLDTDVIEGIGQLGFQIAAYLTTGGMATSGMMLGQGADVMADKTRKDDASQSAKDAAIIAGAGITAMTERIGLDKLLNRVPPEIRNRTLRFIADKAIAFGIEFAQETAEGLLHDLTRRVFTKEDAPILDGALREGTAAGLAAAIVRTALGKRGYTNAKQQEDFFRALGDNSANSKLRERLPDQFQELVAKISESGPVQNVYIPATEFQRYYQEQGIDPAAKAAEFNAKNYTEALASGSDIVIPIDDFTTYLAPTDDLQGLFNDLRLDQGSMTAREFAEYQADEKARLDEIIQRAKEVAGEVQTPDLQFIKQEMINQLIATGYEQTTADAYATVYAKTISNLSERAGLPVKALHDKYNLTVNRPLPDVLTRDTRSDIAIDPLLDRLRTGDMPREQDIYGKSLTDFILEKGGLRPAGELTDIDVGRGKFQKKLIQESGMSADAAAQMAVEAGYLTGKDSDTVTESDLYDALNEEAGGTRQFSINEINDQLMALSQQLEGLDQYLRQLGIDLTQITDNAQVRQLIQQASQTPEGQEIMDKLFQRKAEPKQPAPGESLLAVHNLSEENIKFADKMGGIASPSIGVVTDAAGAVTNDFGDITLIGTKDLADPSVNPVFSGDAYTIRYPRPEWSKTTKAASDELVSMISAVANEFNDGIAQRTEGQTLRNPDAGDLVSAWINSDAVRALYLRQQGQQVDVVYDPVALRSNLTIEQVESLRPLYEIVNNQENQGINESPEKEELKEAFGNLMRSNYQAANVDADLIEKLVNQSIKNPVFSLGVDLRRIEAGEQINKYETYDKIDKQIAPLAEDFRQWVEQTVLSKFDDPYLTINRKKVPYTLDNILKIMTSKKEQRGREQTGVFGVGQTKAASTIKFSDIEQMREKAKTAIVDADDFAMAKQETDETLSNYRDMMSNHPHKFTDTFEILDSSMRAIAKFSTSKTKTPASMRQALRSEGFQNVDVIPDTDIQFAIDAANKLAQTPVPYFESKPQRIVKLNEFAGAVVPLNTSQDVIDILEKNGIRVDYYEGFDRQEVIRRAASELSQDKEGVLFQEERGFIQFGKDRKFNITLLQNADLSTFLHETGHFYLEVLGDLSEMAESSQQIKDDYATVLKFLGLNSRAELSLDGKKAGSAEYQKAVAAHEKFARANELYLMEGKAPSVELRSIFQRFRQWLKLIYKEFTRLNVEINKEVREVFDRIYATDEEIEAAKAELSFDGLLLDAASAGMTDAEFAAYRESVLQATESGKDALQTKIMKELQREREAFWKEETAKTREEVAAEVDATPVFIAFKELTEGDIKLNKAELVEQYGAEYVKNLPRGFKRIYTTGEGMPLDAAANLLGYPSGDALIEALAGMPNRKEYIAAEADRLMKERYGDIMTDGSIADEAKLALHNAQREKVLATELRALRRKQREVAPFLAAERAKGRQAARAALDIPPTSAFRLAAQGMIGQTAIRDLEPQRFINAQRKQGKIAMKAMADGDYTTAADAKQKELLNHFLYLEARKARDNADKIAAYMRKFETKSTRERIGKAGGTYLEQIDAILDGYEFRRIPNKQIDRRAMLNAFVAKMQASPQNDNEFSGEPVNIPQSVLDDGRQINYRLLSVDELNAVNEAVRNIANLAGLKNKLLRIQEKRSLDEIVNDAQEHIISNSKGGKAKKLESALPGENLKRWARGFMLIHTKLATQFRQMDGWQDNGMLWNLFVRPLNERADYEAVERAKATKELRQIFSVFRDTNMMSKQFIPSLGQSMTLQGRLMVALNWGRAENRQRLMDGNGLTQQNIDEIFGTLTERDFQFVQNVWDYFDTYWSDIADQYKRLYGVAPEKSESLPFETQYGSMRGGYFPIKYDPTKTAQAQAQTADEILQQMKSGAYMRSQTKNGFTKEVLEKLDRPIKLDFSSIYEHLNEVIHDLALREYLLDTNKLMNHRVNGTTLRQTIMDQYGDQFYREITEAIRDISIGDIGARGSFEASMAHLRAGVSIVGMGWNLMTGLMQPLGLTQSMVRVGPKWIAKGLMKFGSDAVSLENSARMIYEKSAFMATRNMTQNREINEIRNQIKRSGKYPIAREAWGVIEDSYFQLIIQGQKLVDIPTWLGAEMKALENGADPATAIALADQAVIDAQGGGSIKDLAGIQRGSPLLKIWTNFYSYFNTTLQLTQESFGKTNFKDPISIGRLATDLLLLYTAPAILGVALREAVNLMVGGEEKDEEELIEKLIKEQATYILGTMVGLREFASIFDPRFGYSGPAGARFIAEFGRFAKEVSQGELDEGLRKSAISAGGMLLHFPSGQLNRIIDGITALSEGKTSSPAAIIFGPPKE